MKHFLTLSLLLVFGLTQAQETQDNTVPDSPNLFLRGDVEYGWIVGAGANLPEGIDEVLGGNIEVGWQTTGSAFYDNILRPAR